MKRLFSLLIAAALLCSAQAFSQTPVELVVMNRQPYEKQPAQAKAAIDKYSGERFSPRMGELVSKMDADAQETAQKTPCQVIWHCACFFRKSSPGCPPACQNELR